jgi:hypothetical protein
VFKKLFGFTVFIVAVLWIIIDANSSTYKPVDNSGNLVGYGLVFIAALITVALTAGGEKDG